MINKKIVLSALSIVTSLTLMAGATYAYFTDTATSTNNRFQTGTLDIVLTDHNADTAFVNELFTTTWLPGQDTIVKFDVHNNGTLPVHLRGAATGVWNDAGLAPDMVKVVRVEHWNGSSWVTLKNDPNGISDYFYYTHNGNAGGTYFEILPSGMAQFQLTVRLDPTADNNYQNKTFTSSLSVEARQVTSGATWPTE